jgi:hypothetical protein
MRKAILALATAGAFAGTALPALAWDREDDHGYYRHYHSDDYRPYYQRHDYDHYRPYREHHWWWRHHHHHHGYYDRPNYRRYY